MLKAQYLENKLNSELKFLNELYSRNRQAKILRYLVARFNFEI